MSIKGDASEVYALAKGFTAAASEAMPAMRSVVREGATEVRDAWRTNAAATSGAHGKHYPSSITFETTISAAGPSAEVGPDSSRPQGGMGRGFEFGSKNQPPHLDGTKALDSVGPGIERRIATAAGFLFP